MDDPIAKAKTRAAPKWVDRANDPAQENGGKPWTYVGSPLQRSIATNPLDQPQAARPLLIVKDQCSMEMQHAQTTCDR
jgi:hypothetical protein